MNKEQIKKMIRLHHLWLEGDINGERADFRWADLEGANLRGANLIGADFRWANFRWANFEGANFRGADFRGADLEGANLIGADLEGANFRWANFEGANFRGAFLTEANFEGANLRGTNFEGTFLRGVNLRDCIGNNREIKTLQLGTYITVFTKDMIFVGCQKMLIKDLDSITRDMLLEVGEQKAVSWWHKYGDIIKSIIKLEGK